MGSSPNVVPYEGTASVRVTTPPTLRIGAGIPDVLIEHMVNFFASPLLAVLTSSGKWGGCPGRLYCPFGSKGLWFWDSVRLTLQHSQSLFSHLSCHHLMKPGTQCNNPPISATNFIFTFLLLIGDKELIIFLSQVLAFTWIRFNSYIAMRWLSAGAQTGHAPS
jgi:hypothetical protein